MLSNDCRRGIHRRCTDNDYTCPSRIHNDDKPNARQDDAGPTSPAQAARRSDTSDDDLATGIVPGATFL